jgi:hypothetical protein
LSVGERQRVAIARAMAHHPYRAPYRQTSRPIVGWGTAESSHCQSHGASTFSGHCR